VPEACQNKTVPALGAKVPTGILEKPFREGFPSIRTIGNKGSCSKSGLSLARASHPPSPTGSHRTRSLLVKSIQAIQAQSEREKPIAKKCQEQMEGWNQSESHQTLPMARQGDRETCLLAR
jgi:hypothetical protein